MSAKQQDALLLLELYKIRSKKKMRKARAWYVTRFQPRSAEDIIRLLTSGFDESAYYRMVTSYWDMASAFVLQGAIDEELFHDSNTEYVAVFAKIEPYLEDVRRSYNSTRYLRNLEQLVRRAPDADNYIAKMRQLVTHWAKVSAEQKSNRAHNTEKGNQNNDRENLQL